MPDIERNRCGYFPERPSTRSTGCSGSSRRTSQQWCLTLNPRELQNLISMALYHFWEKIRPAFELNSHVKWGPRASWFKKKSRWGWQEGQTQQE
jgi:hypothetical protein